MKIRTISPIIPDSRKELVSYCTLFAVTLAICQIAPGVTLTDGVNLGSTNTVPTASNSIASGARNFVSNGSMAFGNDSTADNHSFVIGDASRADWGSLTAGFLNTVDSNSYCLLLAGEGNYTGYAAASVLLGTYNSMGLQWGSAAIGNSNAMNFPFGKSGSGNTLLGFSNMIDATTPDAPSYIEGTVLVGSRNTSSSTMAFAFGLGNIGQSETVTIGTYAQPVSNAALIVGRGANQNARSNGIVVLKNGEVQIEGSLVVGGSPVLSQGAASSFLQGQGFVNTSYLNTNGYVKKFSGAGSFGDPNAYIAMGINASAGAESIAIGSNASALSNNAISLGGDSIAGPFAIALQGGQAEGEFSFAASYGIAGGKCSLGLATGWAVADSAIAIGGFDESSGSMNISDGIGSVTIGGATNAATGLCSYALGWNSNSAGNHSYSIGYGTRTNAYQVSMGSRNLSSQNALPNMSNDQWLEEGALFELGNGNPNQTNSIIASNAITTLKNGQTTLTNKEWKAHPSTPLADPAATTDSGGEALVVEGHTRLKGKVIIEQPQGNISMGIYGGN